MSKRKKIQKKTVETASAHKEVGPRFVGEFECIGPDGIPKWRTKWKNLVTNAGKNDLLNKFFGGQASNAWYLGLMSSVPNASTSDMYSNHTGWTEATAYGAARPAVTFAINNTASTHYTAITSQSQSATYGFTGAQSVGGAFICNVQNTSATGSGSTGVLYSAGSFAATRAVANSDTLNVTVTVQFS